MRGRKIKPILLLSLFLFVSDLVFGAHAFIDGQTKNYDGKIGVLRRYGPTYGCPALDGFQDNWFYLKEGKFQIHVNNFTPGDYFELRIGTQSIILLLFNEDNLKVEIEFGDNDNVIFRGVGASRNNALQLINHLEAGKLDGLSPLDKKKRLLETFEKRKNVLAIMLSGKPLRESNITDNAVLKGLEKISKDIKIDKNGFDELTTLISAEYYYNLVRLFGEYPDKEVKNSLESFFEYTRMKEFVLSLKTINHPSKSYLLGDFVVFHARKTFLLKFNSSVEDIRNINAINTSVADMATEVLSPSLTDAYFSFFFYPYITVRDQFENMMFDIYKSTCAGQKYFKYLQNEKKVVAGFLKSTQSKLKDPAKELTKVSLAKLFESAKGKVLVVVFWSGHNIKDVNIPYLHMINKSFLNARFAYICLDEIEDKDFWAYQITKNNIPGEHFFYPTNHTDSISFDNINIVKGTYGFNQENIYFMNKKGNFVQLLYCSNLNETEKQIFDLLKKLEAE